MRDERPTILISAVSGDIGYSVVQSLREKVFKIVGCDLKPYTPVRHLLDRFHVVPPATQRSAYLQAIRTILREEHLQYFIPISEPEISLLNHEREEFDGLGVKLLLNHSWVLDRFLDKMKTMSFLQGIGIQVPKTAFLQGYYGRFGFPIIVKQQAGYGSRKLWKADSPAELEYIKGKVEGSYIVQEYIGTPEEEYTTGVFSDGQKTSSISFKRRLGADGTTLEAVLVQERQLEDLSSKIAEAVSLRGSINIQSRRVGDVFLPFEINPRISGTVLFRKKFGFDDVSWWMDILSGKTYDYVPLFKSGRAIRHYSECYFDMEET